jgi:hypothetical protein
MPSCGEVEKVLATDSTHNACGIRKTDDPVEQEELTAGLQKKGSE